MQNNPHCEADQPTDPRAEPEADPVVDPQIRLVRGRISQIHESCGEISRIKKELRMSNRGDVLNPDKPESLLISGLVDGMDHIEQLTHEINELTTDHVPPIR